MTAWQSARQRQTGLEAQERRPTVENWGIDLHLILREWVEHDNRGRPHMSLGPGFPEPTENLPAQEQPHQHQLPADAKVVAKPILAGLLHEVRLVKRAA